MTDKEKRTVMAVFGELVKMEHGKLNTILGSVTIEEMYKMYENLRCEDYRKRHNIRPEDWTDADYEDAYNEGEQA